MKESLELKWLDVHGRYLQFFVPDTFQFYNNQCSICSDEVFCPVDNYGLGTPSCDKKLKLPFHKRKLGMQSLSYIGPSTWNKLPNNLKTTNNVNCFKHNIKKYSLKKLSDTEADIY